MKTFLQIVFSRLQSLNFEHLIAFNPNPVKGCLLIEGIPTDQASISKVLIWGTAGKLVRESVGIPAEGIDMGPLSTGLTL